MYEYKMAYVNLKKMSTLICITVGFLFFGPVTAAPYAKIVGGHSINITDAPYQVGIEELGLFHCGGTIINREWVVSAAHCLSGSTPSILRIRSGSTERGTGGTLHHVTEGHYHANFSFTTYDNDVSVLRVSPMFNFSDSVQPAPLSDIDPIAGKVASVSGWGALHEGALLLPKELQLVEVPTVNREECNAMYYDFGIEVTPRMICAGVPEGGKDSCQGDSGGPLVINGQLAGIVSWGQGCARQGYPGVYTNVVGVREWIEEHVSF